MSSSKAKSCASSGTVSFTMVIAPFRVFVIVQTHTSPSVTGTSTVPTRGSSVTFSPPVSSQLMLEV